MNTISQTGEFGLIRRIGTDSSDDCARLAQSAGLDTLVSTDMLMEGTHFLRDDILPYDLGWKAAAVNASDIAACGGTPVGLFLSLSLPGCLPVSWFDSFIAGFKALGVPLLGGDTTGSPDRICISVTVLGECPAGRAVGRNGAAAGDLVCVTGCLGDSAAALQAILGGRKSSCPPALLERHYRPVPRVREGAVLASTPGVGAMMDISDGLASDLPHILEESGGLGAVLDASALPLSDSILSFLPRAEALKAAVCGGEDYELLFTMDPSCRPSVPYSVIGEVRSEPGIVWRGESPEMIPFDHFRTHSEK